MSEQPGFGEVWTWPKPRDGETVPDYPPTYLGRLNAPPVFAPAPQTVCRTIGHRYEHLEAACGCLLAVVCTRCGQHWTVEAE